MKTAAARSASELLAEIATWFSRDPLLEPEYRQAAVEFFGGRDEPCYAPAGRETELAVGRCMEWFAYHRPSEILGRTPFEHLLASLALSGRAGDREAMIRFRGQIYDFFEVRKSTDRELVLRSLRSGREYRVSNNPGFSWVRKGFHVLTRIFPWGEGFVASPIMTSFSSRDRWVARFRAAHEGLDPLVVERELFIERLAPDRLLMPRERIEGELADFYRVFGIKESPADTFRALAEVDSPAPYLKRQLPRLVVKPAHMSPYDAWDLATLLMALWHHAPRPELDGKTAYELHRSDASRYQAEILPRLSWEN